MTKSKTKSLYVAWRRADLLFHYWQSSPNKRATDSTYFYSEAGVNIFLAYALLFVVLEGFDDGNSVPSQIKRDVDSIYGNLKQFRNAVFHVQDKVFSEKLKNIMHQKDSTKQIKRVNYEIGKFLSESLDIPFP